MITYLCDRCSIITEEMREITFAVRVSQVSEKGTSTEIFSGWRNKEHHLCMDCHIRLLKFMKIEEDKGA